MRATGRFCRRLSVLGALLAVGASPPADAAHAADMRTEAIDFLVQDVCVDAHDRVIADVTPLDDQARCIRRRDPRVGEALPYHKDDWADDADRASRPEGLQRSDSFPVMANGELLIVDTFQFDRDQSFEAFSQGDGGQIIRISTEFASVILTQDSKGLKYFFGPNCTDPPKPAALDNSWILFDPRMLTSKVASLTAHLEQTLDPETCPPRLSSAYTEFHKDQIRYRADYSHDLTKPLESIITDHYSNTSISRSGSMERMYFTRALGLTRWERWQNLDIAKGEKTAVYQRRAARLRRSGRCDIRAPAPAGEESWVLVDCREWTNLVEVDVNTAEPRPPMFWIGRLTDDPASAHFFGEH